jgi:hypothetical protein
MDHTRLSPTTCLPTPILLVACLLLGGFPARAQAEPSLPAAGPGPSALLFVENRGQFPGEVRFQVRGAGGATLWLAADAIWVSLAPGPALADAASFKLSFAGANPSPELVPFDRLASRLSYFLGDDPARWQADVPAWGGVRYVDLYPGLDLELTGTGGQLRLRLVARPGADPGAVRLHIEGADAVTLEGGRLRLTTAPGAALRTTPGGVGRIGNPTPQGGTSHRLGGGTSHHPGFEAVLPLLALDGAAPVGRPAVAALGDGAFEVSSPFGAEPDRFASPAASQGELLYSTFLGGSGWDVGLGIAVDGVGCAYVAGRTTSPDFPATPGAFDGDDPDADKDAFVAKLSADGSELVYATFFGGSGEDEGQDVAVDAAGNAYVIGLTQSADLPTTPGAFDTVYGDGPDDFVFQLSADGSELVYATYLGGSEDEGGQVEPQAIAVDGAGSAYAVGTTRSADFPVTPGAFDTSLDGGKDAFVAKLAPDGSALLYATFLGGSGTNDVGQGIAVDGAGYATVAGSTDSADFPATPAAFGTALAGGRDAYVAKVNPLGSHLTYARLLGGTGTDSALAIALDEDGSAYVTGETDSLDFPVTADALDTGFNGLTDIFVTKLDARGEALVYSTYLGGNSDDSAHGIAVDEGGSVYLTGTSKPPGFPTISGEIAAVAGNDVVGSREIAAVAALPRNDEVGPGGPAGFDLPDLFVSKIGAGGNELVYSRLLGGVDVDAGYDIAVDGQGRGYVTGHTYSYDFPTTAGALAPTYAGEIDAFVLKMDVGPLTFSISGRVRDVHGQGVSGVAVSSGAGHETVTAGSGTYALNGLRAGEYTLMLARSGYVFQPLDRDVSLPPQAVDQNFLMLAVPVSAALAPGVAAGLRFTDTQGLVTRLDFPAWAVGVAAQVAVTPTLLSGRAGFAFAGHAFEVASSEGEAFGVPVTVTLAYSQEDVRTVSDEEQLALWWWTGSEWQDAAGTCEPALPSEGEVAENVLRVAICRTGLFGLFGPTHQGYLPAIVGGGW